MKDNKTVPESKKQLMSETVHQALRKMIAGRRFTPGQRLNIEELARELGVSRTPVWEAIRRIEQDGIVRNIPNRGVFMVDNPMESIRDRLQVRSAMDQLAGKLACGRLTKRSVDMLSKCLQEQLRGIETSNVQQYLEADIRFHLIICEASGNMILKNLYESMNMYIFPTSFDLLSSLPTLFVVHQDIITGLKEKDYHRVDSAFNRHYDILITHLEKQMKAEASRMELVQRIKAGSNSVIIGKGRSKSKR